MQEMVAVEVHGLQVLVIEPRSERPVARLMHKIGSRGGCRRRLMPLERADAIRAARAELDRRAVENRPIRFPNTRLACPHCGYPDPCRADRCPGCGQLRTVRPSA